MTRFMAIIVLLFSTLSHASFSVPEINWSKLSSEEKEFVIAELRLFFGRSTEAQKKIVTSQRFNDRYLGCPRDKLLCNPALFGEQICVRKDNAYAHCEETYDQKGRLFSTVVDSVHPEEFKDLHKVVNEECAKKTIHCKNLTSQLEKFLPNETPEHLKKAQDSLKTGSPEKILPSLKALQNEMEGDLSTFKKVCEDGVSTLEKIHCKNLALRSKKAKDFLDKAYPRLDILVNNQDCTNCSQKKKTKVGSSDLLDKKLLSSLQCDANKKAVKCDDAVLCALGSSALMTVSLVKEGLLGRTPSSCINSQNSCVTNIITSVVKSIVNLVTGIWDLLGMGLDWTGKKLSGFWDHVKGVEDKTSDAQLLLNKLSDKDAKEISQNPAQWIQKLTTNIWQGIKLWMKEDVFCEQWSGVPRASQCLRPSQGFDCMNCQSVINGTCSAAGVIVAEVVPAFLTGGAVNLVSHGTKGARAFAQVIKVSKNYKSVSSQVSKLSGVKSVELILKGTQKSLSVTTSALSSGYKAIVSSQSFQKTAKAMELASKYTGLRAINSINDRAYALGRGKASTTALVHLSKVDTETNLVVKQREILEPLNVDMNSAYAKGQELSKLKYEVMDLKRGGPSEASSKRLQEIEKKYAEIQAEITVINDSYLTKLKDIYDKDGIPSELVKRQDGSLVLSLDFKAPPTKETAYEFYRRIHKKFGVKDVTLSLKDNAEFGSAGFFQGGAARLDMGPNQGLSMLDDYFNSVSKHESRHSMFFAKRNLGDDSIYHTKFFASPDGNLLNSHKMYDSYMSAEELYTFSTDLQSLAQVFKGSKLTNLEEQVALVQQIAGKNDMFVKVAETVSSVTDGMVSSLDDIMKMENKLTSFGLQAHDNGGWAIRFKDKLNRSTEITLIGKEELALAEAAGKANNRLSEFQNNYLVKKLTESKVDMAKFMERAQANKLTVEEIATLTKYSDEAMNSVEGKALFKDVDSALVPLVQNARDNMSQLKRLSDIQVTESTKLLEIMKEYVAKGSNPEIVEKMKAQMFKVAKNVKEDYKGFALNGK